MADEYKATGSFANNNITAFKKYVKDGKLDVESVKKEWALNDAQIPHLEIELEAAGYFKGQESPSTKVPIAVGKTFTTGSLKPRADE